MPKFDTDNDLGKKNGKLDMDRVGLFSEMPYMIGDKYKPIKISKCNDEMIFFYHSNGFKV